MIDFARRPRRLHLAVVGDWCSAVISFTSMGCKSPRGFANHRAWKIHISSIGDTESPNDYRCILCRDPAESVRCQPASDLLSLLAGHPPAGAEYCITDVPPLACSTSCLFSLYRQRPFRPSPLCLASVQTTQERLDTGFHSAKPAPLAGEPVLTKPIIGRPVHAFGLGRKRLRQTRIAAESLANRPSLAQHP